MARGRKLPRASTCSMSLISADLIRRRKRRRIRTAMQTALKREITVSQMATVRKRTRTASQTATTATGIIETRDLASRETDLSRETTTSQSRQATTSLSRARTTSHSRAKITSHRRTRSKNEKTDSFRFHTGGNLSLQRLQSCQGI